MYKLSCAINCLGIPLLAALGGSTKLKCFMNRVSGGPPFGLHVL